MFDATIESRPRARVEEIITTQAGSSLLVFDERNNRLHDLDPLSASIWRLLDGQRTVAGILSSVVEIDGKPVTIESIGLTLEKLGEIGLLESPAASTSGAQTSQSRRKLLKKVGIAAAVPAIVSITAPMAAAAESCDTPTACSLSTLDQPCCGLQDLEGNLISLETGLCLFGILDVVLCLAV